MRSIMGEAVADLHKRVHKKAQKPAPAMVPLPSPVSDLLVDAGTTKGYKWVPFQEPPELQALTKYASKRLAIDFNRYVLASLSERALTAKREAICNFVIDTGCSPMVFTWDESLRLLFKIRFPDVKL